MATRKHVKATNGMTVPLWSGFDQDKFGDGSVCRLPAKLQAEVGSISHIDVSERKTAVKNTMDELVKAYNKVYGVNIDYNTMDFQNGQHKCVCEFVEVAPVVAVAPAQVETVAQIPATADTAVIPAVVPAPAQAPAMVENPQLTAFIRAEIKNGTEIATIKEQLLTVNTEAVALFHMQKAGL